MSNKKENKDDSFSFDDGNPFKEEEDGKWSEGTDLEEEQMDSEFDRKIPKFGIDTFKDEDSNSNEESTIKPAKNFKWNEKDTVMDTLIKMYEDEIDFIKPFEDDVPILTGEVFNEGDIQQDLFKQTYEYYNKDNSELKTANLDFLD